MPDPGVPWWEVVLIWSGFLICLGVAIGFAIIWKKP